MSLAPWTPRAPAFARRTLGVVWCLTACSVYSLPDQSSRPEEAGGETTAAGTKPGGGASTTGGGSTASGGNPTTGTSGGPSGGVGMDTLGSGGVPDVVGSGGAPDAPGAGGVPDTAGSGGVSSTAGTGGAPSAAGSGGATQPSPVSHRYVKLLATSELGGHVWSSVAELQLMTTGGVALARTGWSVTADSEELSTEKAPATNAIDGDTATYWHTHWQWAPNDVNDAPLPHYLIVDLGTAAPITGFSYLPRQNSANGRIKDWSLYVSNDGTNWGSPIKSGTFSAGASLSTITF